MFNEMPVNDTFQVQILASSVWDPPKRATGNCPGYEVKAAQKVVLTTGKVTNVNLGMSFSLPCGTSIVILPATGSLASKWSLYGRTLKSNSTGEALVAVKNNSSLDVVILAGEVLGQVVVLPREIRPIASIQMPTATETPDDGFDVAAIGFVEACTSGMPPDRIANYR